MLDVTLEVSVRVLGFGGGVVTLLLVGTSLPEDLLAWYKAIKQQVTGLLLPSNQHHRTGHVGARVSLPTVCSLKVIPGVATGAGRRAVA